MEEVSSVTREISHHVTVLDFILSRVSLQPNGEKQ